MHPALGSSGWSFSLAARLATMPRIASSGAAWVSVASAWRAEAREGSSSSARRKAHLGVGADDALVVLIGERLAEHFHRSARFGASVIARRRARIASAAQSFLYA